MKTYREALAILSEVAKKRSDTFGSESLAIEKAVGRISAENIYVKIAQPTFDNSSRDGFALRSEWTLNASASAPKELEILACLAAGGIESQTSFSPSAFEIMTGAKMPTGFDTVIQKEDARIVERNGKTFLVIGAPLGKGTWVRLAGEDFALQDSLIARGQKISSAHVLALASQGLSHIAVKNKLRIGLLSTGSEIIPHGEIPPEGMIRNTTLPYLQTKFESPALSLEILGSVTDSPEKLRALLEPALKRLDVVVTTGAVSVGTFDIVPDVVADLDATQHIHKVALRPGKPLLFCEFKEGPLLMGFPGNPLSSAVAFRFLLEPLLRSLLGMAAEKPYRLSLADDVKKPEQLCCFWKAKVESLRDELSQVRVLEGQESFRIKPFLKTDHWAVFPEGKELYKAGESVEVYPVDSTFL